MNEDEVHTFLEFAKTMPYYALFYLILYTALRRSEILALRWCDIDRLMGEVSVTRSLHRLRDGSIVIRPTKTGRARRLVTLPPSASLVVRQHKEKRALECTMLGVSLSDEDFAFSHVDGTPLLPDTVSHVWTKTVKRAGLKHFRLHDGRHTHASLLLKQNVHPKVVQERLGHASISTTLDLYSHVVPGLQEAAARRFDEALSPEYNKMVGKGEDVEANSKAH